MRVRKSNVRPEPLSVKVPGEVPGVMIRIAFFHVVLCCEEVPCHNSIVLDLHDVFVLHNVVINE